MVYFAGDGDLFLATDPSLDQQLPSSPGHPGARARRTICGQVEWPQRERSRAAM
jgi:hypothetical protein